MLGLLRCPLCRGPLKPSQDALSCACGAIFPIIKGVVAFHDDAHAGSFSEQWDQHCFTQVDSKGYRCGYHGFADSHDTFWKKTGLTPADLSGKVVLDCGCGPGRFSEVAAEYTDQVIGLDISRAVYHAASLVGKGLFLKASLEAIPLADASVDAAFSIGVLHHTPNPETAFREIVRVLKPGGVFAGWVYARGRSYGMEAREKWRRFTSDPANAEWVWKFAEMAPALRDLAHDGQSWTILHEILGISGSTNDAECVCDTFDWLTPQFQFQYTVEEIRALLQRLGLQNIQMLQFPVSWRATK